MPFSSIAQYGLASYTESSFQRPGNYSVFPYKAEGDGLHDRRVPHRHDFYQLIWLMEGSGRLQCDLHEWSFQSGTLFFAAPGRLHCWQPETPASGIALGFTDEFLCADSARSTILSRFAYLHETEKPLLTISGAERTEMTHLFNCLLSEAALNQPGRDEVVRAYIMIILAKARRWMAAKEGRPLPPPVVKSLSLRFRHGLEEHFPRLLKVKDYADLLHTSRTQLNMELRQNTGRTASEHIHDRLLLEAKRLLLYSDATISEIAYELQFQDPSYFCRFFRHRSGQSPGAYRTQAKVEPVAC